MRNAPTILHLDMDAFFASVEQASKPSLRGKAVVVGGLGPRGVVATASYEARAFGVHSAMPMAQARRLAPNAAYLVPRSRLYWAISEQVMALLRELSPLVEPLSLDEAFVDLEAGGAAWDEESARRAGEKLRADIRAVTGLTGSVGLAASKMLAKIASEQAKPDGLRLIEPGTERALLGPMPVRILPGVGPATGDHLRRAGISTVQELAEAGEDELVRLLGKAHGHALYAMALARDERPVVAEREAKSVSVEDTYDVDIHDRLRVGLEVQRLADRCVRRLRGAGLSGRTIVLKVRRYDFSTLTRSETLRGPTDDPAVVREAAARLLDSVDTTGGVRLLGVGVSGLADYTQEDLFAQAMPVPVPEEPEQGAVEAVVERPEPAERQWHAGQDVRHAEYGHGWVQGSGLGRVTVRFETPQSPPGRVRTFFVGDPALEVAEPLPLVPGSAHPPARLGPPNSDRPGASPQTPEEARDEGGTRGRGDARHREEAEDRGEPQDRAEAEDRGDSQDRAEAGDREEGRVREEPEESGEARVREDPRASAAAAPWAQGESWSGGSSPSGEARGQVSSEPASLPKSWSGTVGGAATSRP
ncbi:DNA polymerase IV [Streptomyces sp. FBKL.4005]|nr:DNA polymerase IV [Streptomyces sp. FBKL.4005]